MHIVVITKAVQLQDGTTQLIQTPPENLPEWVRDLVRGDGKWTPASAIEQIERCDFECIAGPLTNNVAWRWLKEHLL
jgi:hypothetical protein